MIGKRFLLLTDHAALTYLHTTASVSRRNARWLDFLSQFNFEIQHIKGRDNVVADVLSRVPGAEDLSSAHLCSMTHSFGVPHVNDVPLALVSSALVAPVITIFENDTFLE